MSSVLIDRILRVIFHPFPPSPTLNKNKFILHFLFQVGTIVDSPADFYHARIPKKERKKTIVDELLTDSEFRRYLLLL